jgi:tRNA threonylcarbamoyladenosine biosynthesis protein TsaB
MLLLGIDTSGKSGGVTLADGDERTFCVLGSSPIAGGTFSAQLVPTIARLLENHGSKLADIGGFAVASGPGSFTGLRVGLSAIKGLAEILRRPIATVSLLEALALAPEKSGSVAAALDAGRSEVFYGLYQVFTASAEMIAEKLLSQGQFLEALSASGTTLFVTSDASIADVAQRLDSNVQAQVVERPDSAAIARIGLRKLLAGDTVSVEALDANYIRRSDAEIFFKGGK